MANNGNRKLIMWLVGVLFTAIVFVWLPTLTNAVIENDQCSRSRDTELREKQVKQEEKTQDKFEQVMISLMEITTDLKYVKQQIQ